MGQKIDEDLWKVAGKFKKWNFCSHWCRKTKAWLLTKMGQFLRGIPFNSSWSPDSEYIPLGKCPIMESHYGICADLCVP